MADTSRHSLLWTKVSHASVGGVTTGCFQLGLGMQLSMPTPREVLEGGLGRRLFHIYASATSLPLKEIPAQDQSQVAGNGAVCLDSGAYDYQGLVSWGNPSI